MPWQTIQSPDPSWLPPPARTVLPADRIHVWRAALDLPAERMAALQSALTAAELERAGRFRLYRDRQRFIVARGLLRRILSAYLDVDPGRVRLAYGDRGKPHLARGHDGTALHLNLSHSNGLALYAFARRRRVGIDLERVQPFPQIERVVARIFPADEGARFRAAPPEEQLELFYSRWTLAEAYLKATGRGLALFEGRAGSPPTRRGPTTWTRAGDDGREPVSWSLRRLYPGPGYAAALAVEGIGWQLDCWQVEG